MRDLVDFVRESNLIEGIEREPTHEEVSAHELFLAGPVNTDNLCSFVARIQPGAQLRATQGLNVRVGSHRPPPGGPKIVKALPALIEELPDLSPYEAHQRYEHLHPFTDGNGRSGRVLWAWHMSFYSLDPFTLEFKHLWYYQSLSAWRDSR